MRTTLSKIGVVFLALMFSLLYNEVNGEVKMKAIVNWKAIYVDENGEEGIGILLPGCVIKGELVETKEEITVETVDVDISDLVITATTGETYKLLDASRDYLQDLKKCIEIGLEEREEGAR